MSEPNSDEEIVSKLERDIEHIVSNPDLYTDTKVAVQNVIRTTLAAVREEERERIFSNINSKENYEQIMGALLMRLTGGEGEVEIPDNELMASDWVVFERRHNPERMSTSLKVVKNRDFYVDPSSPTQDDTNLST